MKSKVRSIKAADLKEGQWLSLHGHDMRVVEVTHGPLDDQVKVSVDYGNDGEPATNFYNADERVLAYWPE